MQKVAILYDASQAVLSTFDLDEVLDQILSIVRDYFHLENGAILLLDPKRQMLDIRSSFGEHTQFSVPVGEGLTGTAAKRKRPIYAGDVTKDARYIRNIESTRSELAIPLMVRDEVVGVLDCQSKRENFFDNETIDLLTLFSTQASIALENARLYSLEQRRAGQLEAINAIAKQTTTVLDLKELLDKICELMIQSFANIEHAALLLREGEMLAMAANRGKLTPAGSLEAQLPYGMSLAGRAIQTGRAVVANDVSEEQGYVATFTETQAEMCLPLISFGEVLGVILLDSARKNAFPPTDVQPLESVADICAAAIQNARHFEKTKQLAFLDGLTGIYNRRYFEQTIMQEIERCRRYEKTMSVIMLDIDHFKKLNDEFGHLLGDEALRQVSALMVQNVRKADIVCRYGGEEFAVLAPETTGENAVGIAEKLRRAVETWHFPGVPRPVTVTAGVAEFPAQGNDRDELVKAADGALYAAKQAGRNRVLAAARASAVAKS